MRGLFPTPQGFLVQVPPVQPSRSYPIFRAEQESRGKQGSQDHDNGGTRGDIRPERDQQARNGAHDSDDPATPRHGAAGVPKKVDGGGGQNEKAQREQHPDRLQRGNHGQHDENDQEAKQQSDTDPLSPRNRGFEKRQQQGTLKGDEAEKRENSNGIARP